MFEAKTVAAWARFPRLFRTVCFRGLYGLIAVLSLPGCTLPDPQIAYPAPIHHAPAFDAYPAEHVYEQAPKPVNLLSHPRALHFKDRLVMGAKIGPNFAGYYTIVRWNCGDDCQQFAVVDARTGSVIFAPFVTHLGFRFRLDSRLLIVNPPEAVERAARAGKPRAYYRTVYYVWHFDRFTGVYAIQHR